MARVLEFLQLQLLRYSLIYLTRKPLMPHNLFMEPRTLYLMTYLPSGNKTSPRSCCQMDQTKLVCVFLASGWATPKENWDWPKFIMGRSSSKFRLLYFGLGLEFGLGSADFILFLFFFFLLFQFFLILFLISFSLFPFCLFYVSECFIFLVIILFLFFFYIKYKNKT